MSAFHDYWLRGDSQGEVETAMASAGIPLLPSTMSSYDAIGTIWRDTGEVDADGNPVMEPIPGWHANLRMVRALTEGEEMALDGVLIQEPQHPVRVWA